MDPAAAATAESFDLLTIFLRSDWVVKLVMIGLLADLINFNRQLIEMTLEKVRRLELQADTSGQPARPEARAAWME